LAAVADGHEACAAVERLVEVLALDHGPLAGVDAHTDSHRA